MKTEWILPAAGVGSMLLTLLVFGGCWIGMRRRRLKVPPGIGEWINGLGFGILPAMAVAKVYGQYTESGSTGTEIIQPLKPVLWITENGRFFPGRIEILFFLAAFTGICLWLIFRKSEFPPNGDMAGVSLTLWAGIRTVTETLREVSQMDVGEWRIVYLAIFAVTSLWLILWTFRRQKTIKNTSQTVIYWLVTIVTTAAVWVLVSGTLTTGSSIGNLAAVTGCSIARTAALLAAGGDSRKV